jgi:5S rRNA maturation endonuclease (ribonuclease M5)
MENIKEILSNLGYDLKEYLKEYRTKPLYRDSDNENVLVIYKDSGKWIDYKENTTGNLQDLVRMTLNLPNNTEAKEWISKKVQTEASYTVYRKPQIKQVKCYSNDVLDKLIKDHSFWKKRNISEETMNIFNGGILTEGRMKGRYIFPILDKQDKLIGVAGRDILNRNEKFCPKWKLIGDKINWRYPLQVNAKILSESKEVIIVESIGDMLSLWEAGVKNVIVTFGLALSVSILNTLLVLNPNKIYISFNNDEFKNKAGNLASEKAKEKLLKHFDRNQIQIALPIKKDFGEMNKEEILQWKNNL